MNPIGTMDSRTWHLIEKTRLTLDQTDTPIEMDRQELEKFYYPIASRLLQQLGSSPRLLAAIAGPPGSGKSAFAAILAAALNAAARTELAAWLGLDGWHYPNAYLDTNHIERKGQIVLLRNIKGSPESFDAAAAGAFLNQVRQPGKVRFPIYSRELHDPLVDAGVVETHHQILLFEGNYWLLNESPWKDFKDLFDVKIFLTAQPEHLLDGLIQRHVRGGKDPMTAEQHVRQVDVPNILRVLQGSSEADILVYKHDHRWIESIRL